MKTKIGNGQLSNWFMEASEDELLIIAAMSSQALYKICLLVSLEQQLMLEQNKNYEQSTDKL